MDTNALEVYILYFSQNITTYTIRKQRFYWLHTWLLL